MMRIVLICSNVVSAAELDKYLPTETKEVISLGERSLSDAVKDHLSARGIVPVDFKPGAGKTDRAQYEKRTAALLGKADVVLASWDGKSAGTKALIDRCSSMKVPLRVFV